MIPGRKVLIRGAAGGVGSFAMQFAKSGGLLVAATCGCLDGHAMEDWLIAEEEVLGSRQAKLVAA